MTDQAQPDYRDWIGNRETAVDWVTPVSVAGLSVTLDRDDPAPEAGDELPPLWHWMYFGPRARWSKLGPDGHPARGGFLPPVALPRRMFAGAQYKFHKPVRVGDEIRREGEVLDVTEKQGRSGHLVFVRIGYNVFSGEELLLEETHDVVYREDTAPAQTPTKESADNDHPWSRTVVPDPVLLFRYSALTFNGHRIHYDRRYAEQEEGYPGLLVHGPLIVTFMLELLRGHMGDPTLKDFAFRARRPLFDIHPFQVVGGPRADAGGDGDFWLRAIDNDGAVAMEAHGSLTA